MTMSTIFVVPVKPEWACSQFAVRVRRSRNGQTPNPIFHDTAYVDKSVTVVPFYLHNLCVLNVYLHYNTMIAIFTGMEGKNVKRKIDQRNL